MQHGFEETGRNKVNYARREACWEEIGHLFLRHQPRRGAGVKIEMLMSKGIEETRGHTPVTLSVKSPLEGECAAGGPRQAQGIWTNPGGIHWEATKYDEKDQRVEN